MYAERRRFKRVAVESRCWCEGKNVTLYVQIRNVSFGGLFIKTHTPFNPGEQVKVRWSFPALQGEHEAIMTVVWKRETFHGHDDVPGMGLKFLRIPEETAGILRKIVEREPGLPE